jgi:oleandomycin transport system permease protein
VIFLLLFVYVFGGAIAGSPADYLQLARSAPLVGAILADLVRYLTSGLIMVAIGFVLGFRITTTPLALVATFALVMVFAFALCWVFTALAMVVGQPRSVQGLGALVMLPITFGSNAFVPASTMPAWLRGFVEINPVTHVVDAARGLLTGGPVAAPVVFSLISSGVVLAVFAPLAVYLYRRRT